MNILSRFWWVILLIVVGLYAVSGMNSLAPLDEQANAAWAQVENQYQRRADLVPNLVETVKGVANFEQKTLTDVTEARARATQITLSPQMLNDPDAVAKFQQAQGALSSSLSRLLVASENYPQLRANDNFTALQSQLEGTENRIAVARKDYIAAVQAYNIRVRTFPGVIWARILGMQPKAEFKADAGAEHAPAVKF